MNLPLTAATDPGAPRRPLSPAERRRTFAIIAHPDAGKTTLTEKLLLLGGAIQEAGAVRARGERRRTRSDWMKIEQQRGISVSASVMTFEHEGLVFNLLDTPGHQDFSEDTYRTLTAVDSAVMVLDAAKGIESQTLKLFEVCRLRDVPIITFINKFDREGRHPFALMEEIEKTLALDAAPILWPLGTAADYRAGYDLLADRLEVYEGGPAGADERNRLEEDISLARAAPAARAPAADRSSRFQGDRLRLQGAGEHGSQSPRPRRFPAPVLRTFPPRHEADAEPNGQADLGQQPDVLRGPRARPRRGSLSRRHHRHRKPRHASHRRCADRGRGGHGHWHSELRPRNP